jgi:hypothetical protein
VTPPAANGCSALAADLQALREAPHTYSPREALFDLVERAQRRPRGVRINGAVITLQRGELLTSERDLAERWQWTRHEVRVFLHNRQLAGSVLQTRIAQRAAGISTKLTLVGFDTYVKPSTKGNQARDQANSVSGHEMRTPADRSLNQSPPHTPPVVQPSLHQERSRPLQGGSGGGVASARDVEKPRPRVENGDRAPSDAHAAQAAHARPPAEPAEQLELPPPIEPHNPEHLRYAEELAATLNRAQLENNGRVDRETYRPIAAHHRGTLAAALAIKNAGVPLTYATQYVWLEGQRYKPNARAPQIASVAYLARGCIAAFRELERKHRQRVGVAAVEERPRSSSALTRAGDDVARLMSHLAGDRRREPQEVFR